MEHHQDQKFTQILEDNKDRIFRICRIYAVAPIEPQDLFQEVVFQIWKSLSTFKGTSNISTWIYKIALNVCSRSKLKLNKSNSKEVRFESIQYLATDNIPDDNQKEKYRALHDCISTLKKENKAIIVLYLDELPYKEIAVITGLTENHIAVKMKRIKNILLNCITPKLK